jgi:hypothetical protein
VPPSLRLAKKSVSVNALGYRVNKRTRVQHNGMGGHECRSLRVAKKKSKATGIGYLQYTHRSCVSYWPPPFIFRKQFLPDIGIGFPKNV